MKEERASPDVGSTESQADPVSTIELIERARGGDRSAVMVQDVLLQTFKRLDDFDARGTGALFAYLRQAVNRVRDELRRKARRPEATALRSQEMDRGLSPLEHAMGREALGRPSVEVARNAHRALVRLVAEIDGPPSG